ITELITESKRWLYRCCMRHPVIDCHDEGVARALDRTGIDLLFVRSNLWESATGSQHRGDYHKDYGAYPSPSLDVQCSAPRHIASSPIPNIRAYVNPQTNQIENKTKASEFLS